MMSERFPRMNIRDVHLDERDADAEKRVPDRDGRVRVRAFNPSK
jgi:hypothetical protein